MGKAHLKHPRLGVLPLLIKKYIWFLTAQDLLIFIRVGGKAFYSDKIQIGNPALKKIVSSTLVLLAGAVGYIITRPLAEPPAPE